MFRAIGGKMKTEKARPRIATFVQSAKISSREGGGNSIQHVEN